MEELPVPSTPTYRPPTNFHVVSDLASPLNLAGKALNYSHQYSSMYFARLALLRKELQHKAQVKWANVAGNPSLVKRVLEVKKGTICYLVGTVYMDMPLKPNILEDIGKDDWVTAPPARLKYTSENDSTMLEDESGRIKLVGSITDANIVTGVIIAVLGMEATSGQFEVIDYCLPGMASQLSLKGDGDEIDVDAKGEWIALVSGLDIGLSENVSAAETDFLEMPLQLLVEYLTSEAGGVEDQASSAQISRLVIAGNSVVPVVLDPDADDPTKNKRYTAVSKTKYSPVPLQTLASTLTDVSRSLPVHLLPGANDPTGTTLPQQPLPKAMFGKELNNQRSAENFICETNPAWIGIGQCEMLVVSGQTLDDIFKYLEDNERLSTMRNTLEWRHMAPTAPDTLWCYPYLHSDPFILSRTPHIYVVGNQPEFGTEIVEGPEGQTVRMILLPRFSQSGLLVLVNTGSLEVKTVEFGVAA